MVAPQDLISNNQQLASAFSRARFLVLDEADRLLDPSFEGELLCIAAALPSERQTLLFSATMTRSLVEMQSSVLKDAHCYQVPRSAVVNACGHAHGRRVLTWCVSKWAGKRSSCEPRACTATCLPDHHVTTLLPCYLKAAQCIWQLSMRQSNRRDKVTQQAGLLLCRSTKGSAPPTP